jgi:hypothetical protein
VPDNHCRPAGHAPTCLYVRTADVDPSAREDLCNCGGRSRAAAVHSETALIAEAPPPFDPATAARLSAADVAAVTALAAAAELARLRYEVARLALEGAQARVHAAYGLGRVGGPGGFELDGRVVRPAPKAEAQGQDREPKATN